MIRNCGFAAIRMFKADMGTFLSDSLNSNFFNDFYKMLKSDIGKMGHGIATSTSLHPKNVPGVI